LVCKFLRKFKLLVGVAFGLPFCKIIPAGLILLLELILELMDLGGMVQETLLYLIDIMRRYCLLYRIHLGFFKYKGRIVTSIGKVTAVGYRKTWLLQANRSVSGKMC
jgi:hypothetical protein